MRYLYIFHFGWNSKPQKVSYTDALSSCSEGYPVSLWEIEIKHLTNPKNLAVSSKVISAVAEVSGYTLIPLNPLSIYRLPELKRPDSAPRHKDPFDKILICQAITEEMVFLTHDSLISDYGVSNVLVV